MTREEAVGFLQESGWLQDHDRQIYEQGKRDGIKWHPYPKEKPTEESEKYMVTTDCGEVENRWRYYTFWVRATSKVVAWAELPKPYEEGADNE